jgi:hypothetical protein
MTLNAHEAEFLAFVAESQVRRISALLAGGSKQRGKLRAMLPRAVSLDDRYPSRVPACQQNADHIYTTLRDLGAPERCHVISEHTKLDATTPALLDALNACVAHGSGTFISCVAGRLGYYEFEDINERYLLRLP